MQRLGRQLRHSFLFCAVVVCTTGAVCAPVAGAEDASDRAVLEAALQTRGAIAGVPILSGERWQKMSHDDKLYFISGAGHVIAIENALISRFPQLVAPHLTVLTSSRLRAMIESVQVDAPAAWGAPKVAAALCSAGARPWSTGGRLSLRPWPACALATDGKPPRQRATAGCDDTSRSYRHSPPSTSRH